MTGKELSELWRSIPTLGDIDADVVVFGHAVERQALERAAHAIIDAPIGSLRTRPMIVSAILAMIND